jgi:hypothetical protein
MLKSTQPGTQHTAATEHTLQYCRSGSTTRIKDSDQDWGVRLLPLVPGTMRLLTRLLKLAVVLLH